MLNKIKGFAFSFWGVSIAGILLGAAASAVNQNEFWHYSFLGSMAETYGYWVVFGSVIALNSKTQVQAALNCFLFFLFMLAAFYGYEWLVTGNFLMNYLYRWLLAALATPIGGYLVFYVKEKKWLGIAGTALPIIMLGSESFFILTGITNERVVRMNGIMERVPTNAWYMANDILKVLIYMAFAGYLLYIFPKTKRRMAWLLAAMVLLPIPAYYLLSMI